MNMKRRTWKVIIVAYFTPLSQNFPVETDENHENLSE
jgi:hypothetical protein